MGNLLHAPEEGAEGELKAPEGREAKTEGTHKLQGSMADDGYGSAKRLIDMACTHC